MIGVTLSLGGYVTAAALTQSGVLNMAAAGSASVAEGTTGKLVAFAYATTGSTAGCPTYSGAKEGKTLTVALFDFGSTPFAPFEASVNGTLYPGPYSSLAPGVLGTIQIVFSGCVHSSSQQVALVDQAGDEVQFGT